MTTAMWMRIDGETKPCRLAEVGDVLPDVAQVTLFGETLVVVDYTVFKARVKAKQNEGRD